MHRVSIVISLDGPAMAARAASVGLSGTRGFKRVKTTIGDEVRCPVTELQTNREANHAMQATPTGAPDG